MPDDEKMEEPGPSEAPAASSPAPSTAPAPGATRPAIPSAGRGPGIYYRCRIPSGTVAMENDLDTDDERDDDLRSQCPTLEALPSLPPIGSSCAGYLASVDRYMNLHLASTEEWVDGTFSGNLGEVLIRCVRRGGGGRGQNFV